MLSQRSRLDTLVPPNFSTIHGAFGAGDGAGGKLGIVGAKPAQWKEAVIVLVQRKKTSRRLNAILRRRYGQLRAFSGGIAKTGIIGSSFARKRQ
jgi:hypothetical protein